MAQRGHLWGRRMAQAWPCPYLADRHLPCLSGSGELGQVPWFTHICLMLPG